MCSKVKHTCTNGGECKKLNSMTPKCILTFRVTFALKEKPHFSTMFLDIFQFSFIVENITFNCKMFFATQK
jgi:hypothetical protein